MFQLQLKKHINTMEVESLLSLRQRSVKTVMNNLFWTDRLLDLSKSSSQSCNGRQTKKGVISPARLQVAQRTEILSHFVIFKIQKLV